MSRIPVGRGAIGEQSHAWLALRSGDVAPFFALALAKPALGLSRAADETGNTALHWLASLGDLESARKCLALGADVSSRLWSALVMLFLRGATRN